jgi:hypothetical protein
VRQREDFDEFYQANYRRLVAILFAVLGDRDEAEDAVQEAFARAYLRWPRLSSYDLPETWVRRVALRIAIDSGRRWRRRLGTMAKLLEARQPGQAEPSDALPFTPLGRAPGPPQARRAGALACACVATSVGLIFGSSPSPTTNVTSAAHPRACTSHDLAATWLPPAPVKGMYMEPPPRTYLLELRNTGPVACSLDGWPRLVVANPRLRGVLTIEYRTHFSEMVNHQVSRVVKPTRLVLKAHERAVSAVTISLPPMLAPPCTDDAAWSVVPPGQENSAIRSHGARSEICGYTTIVVSPLYPPMCRSPRTTRRP